MPRKFLGPILIVATVAVVLIWAKKSMPNPPHPEASKIILPISNAQARITKKPFGIYVTPENSPVSPERFTGYHTGVDFETFADEQNADVPIFAICPGSLLVKKWASGYGGVAVERCVIDDQTVTVVYGHLRFDSIAASVGSQIESGQQIAVLGKGYSAETDGERKHLHLGIHKGPDIDIRGYVSIQSELKDWINALELL